MFGSKGIRHGWGQKELSSLCGVKDKQTCGLGLVKNDNAWVVPKKKKKKKHRSCSHGLGKGPLK